MRMIQGLKMMVFESIYYGHQICETNAGTTNLLDIGNSVGLEHFLCLF